MKARLTITLVRTGWLTFMLAALLASSGCAVVHNQVTPGVGDSSLQNFKRAYVEPLAEDGYQIYPALVAELSDMGMTVVAKPIPDPQPTDLLVRFSYEGGWDLAPYLRAFQFHFMEAGTGRLVAVQSFSSRGIWLGVRDARLKAAFNELRAKNGYPPSKQFP